MKKKKAKVIKKVEVTPTVAQPISKRTRLLIVGVVMLISLGILGAVSERNNHRFVSSLAEQVGLKQKTILPTETNQPQTNPQLSKEYIYAGSRQLAVEDYGIAQPNPTPTP
jgi:hypothetical protein